MWPFGEETLHEAIAETYIPLLNALYDLKAEGHQPKLTIGLTPILLEQLADRDVMAHFERYLQEKLALVEQDLLLHEARPQDAPLLSLAAFYRRWYETILSSLVDRYHRDLADAFARLQSDGVLDIVTGAATHGYLPLMERDSSIYGQLATGITASHQHLGRRPRGIWLPECGYRPAYLKEDGPSYLKPGVEDFLGHLNLGYFFTETNVVTGGQMVGKVAGDVVGPYGGLPVRKLVKAETPEPTE
jgi:1,4-alpha-glucan branching enzyme